MKLPACNDIRVDLHWEASVAEETYKHNDSPDWSTCGQTGLSRTVGPPCDAAGLPDIGSFAPRTTSCRTASTPPTSHCPLRLPSGEPAYTYVVLQSSQPPVRRKEAKCNSLGAATRKANSWPALEWRELLEIEDKERKLTLQR